jgi:hypothetical protein
VGAPVSKCADSDKGCVFATISYGCVGDRMNVAGRQILAAQNADTAGAHMRAKPQTDTRATAL